MNIRSDRYLIQFLDVSLEGENSAKTAYKLFIKRARKPYPATYPTMRRWFGLDGYSALKREQAYKVAFSLEMTLEELNSLLMVGIQEPGVQYHDYHEMIFAYGLCNRLTYEDTVSMIDSFEGEFDNVVSLTRTHNTNQMKNQFEINRGLSREEFIRWMVFNGSDFKGYSMTAIDYLNKYKNIIVEYMRRDAQDQIDMLLRETDYGVWQKKRTKRYRTKYELVRKYILHCRRQKNPSVSRELLDIINELNNLSKPDNYFNTSVLSEVYGYEEFPVDIPAMTQKHLSDLLNLPVQKERDFKAGIAENVLRNLPESSSCPQWIADFIFQYTMGRSKVDTVMQAKNWIREFRKEHHRRCTLIQRTDFLPMILYVAQRRYSDRIYRENREYQQEEAKKCFLDMANAVFAACGMEKISENFPMDAAILSCFQQEEMQSLNEMAELAASLREK